MKTWIIAVLSLIAVFFIAGCESNIEEYLKQEPVMSQAYEDISPAEVKKRLGTEKGTILLDVRTSEEYAEKHIPGSILIPVDVLENEAEGKLKDKNATIFVYCRSGRRSVTASEILVKLGYKKVYNLGGIIDWPYETESGNR